ncbi:unnamed protein product, partial [Allacma fusca]
MYYCSICICSLAWPPRNECDDAAADPDNKIAATPCGHVFHDFCIRKWMSNQCGDDGGNRDQDQSNCPYCRKEFRTLNQIFLSTDESSLGSSGADGKLGGSDKGRSWNVTNLMAKLRLREGELNSLRDSNTNVSMRCSKLMQGLQSCQRKLNYQLQVTGSFAAENSRLKQLVKATAHERDHLQNQVKMVTLRNQKLLAELSEQENKFGKTRKNKNLSPGVTPTPPKFKVAKMRPALSHYPTSNDRSARCYPSEIAIGRVSGSSPAAMNNLYPEVEALPSTVLRPNIQPALFGNFSCNQPYNL